MIDLLPENRYSGHFQAGTVEEDLIKTLIRTARILKALDDESRDDPELVAAFREEQRDAKRALAVFFKDA
jgi:hypothetical protein